MGAPSYDHPLKPVQLPPVIVSLADHDVLLLPVIFSVCYVISVSMANED